MPPLLKEGRVAVVGTGLAGLTTAFLLARNQGLYVDVYETATSPSLDSASITLQSESDGSYHRVDLPMRSFAGGYYPNLRQLYDFLGVSYQPQSFLFSFAAPKDLRTRSEKSTATSTWAYFHHPSRLAYFPPRPSETPRTRHLVTCLWLLSCYTWFTFCVFVLPPRESENLGAYLSRILLSETFISQYLLPLISAVATCSHDELLATPAKDVAGYKRRTHWQPHLSVQGGVSDAQRKLVDRCKETKRVHFHFSHRVLDIRPVAGGEVEVEWVQDQRSDSKRFDRVVIATPPDVVGKIFGKLKSKMAAIPTIQVTSMVTQRNEGCGAFIISDEIPASVTNGRGQEEEQIVLRTDFSTRNTEAVHHIPCGASIVTCPLPDSNSAPGILRQTSFTRVLRTVASRNIVNEVFKSRHFETKALSEDQRGLLSRGKLDSDFSWHSGDDGVYLVGGWCWDGMVLLEGCVVSAIRVASDLGVTIPWGS